MPLSAFKNSIPNPEDRPIFAAVKEGSIADVRKVFEANKDRVPLALDRDSKTVLHIAASLGRAVLIPMILERGVDVNTRDKDGWTALHHAAFVNQLDAIHALLKHGADVHRQNNHGRTPVHIASEWENIEVLETLLETGGPVCMTIADELGRTPMEYATPETRKTLMKYVVKFSNVPNAGTFDMNKLLLKAAQTGNIQAIANLIDPVDKNMPCVSVNDAIDKDGWTPLHHAAFMNHVDVVRYLLEKGANPKMPNKFGRTVIHIAAEWENEDAMALVAFDGLVVTRRLGGGQILDFIGKEASSLVLQPDASGRIAIEYAANDTIKELLKAKAIVTEESIEEEPVATTKGRKSLEETEWQSWEVDPAQLVIEEKVGSGITADVFRGTWRGTDVAIKKINWDPREFDSTVAAFHRELMIMAKCRHPNLVLFMGAATKSAPLMMVCEFCEGGTLFDLAHNKLHIDISWRQRLKMMLDIAKGLNYLHTCDPPIIHRDLKSLNLLLVERVEDEYDAPIVKVADFGLSKLKASATQNMTANAGTYHWMAPEVLDGQSYDEKVDSYSFAIVMYEILCRIIPYEDTGRSYLLVSMRYSGILFRAPRGCPPQFIALMEKCWAARPEDRPGFESIIRSLKKVKIAS
ncbi:serine-threonine protein kinase, putative [Perkinsus marinus ATCC 50983]|uniref:Serine-threonine protein kinase, putative n=1 Tax=Perkinsus marinus (strain ATCC 50983 / TXsc) TaxID=423536 RepID=C5LXA0_PERM5|nr:serine-threonine protein kinase, putative [Perkinsus marinus ATCC 50983]EEQ98649.1 serine-threonine protein kinase, putative [Perkinsus marinus ATCC 50983]|eukprot:XP_002765932.1 serine-threonine protein kinase, putative [Perkinsus marinus ATCC 50983]